MPYGNYSSLRSPRRSHLANHDVPIHHEEAAGMEIAEDDDAVTARAREIVAKTEAIWKAQETERRNRESWLEEQARLTESLACAYSNDGSERTQMDDEEEEDLLTYCPSERSMESDFSGAASSGSAELASPTPASITSPARGSGSGRRQLGARRGPRAVGGSQ